MIQLDPIIAVKDVEASSAWYQGLLGCRSIHGGDEFDVLADEQGDILLCLHHWGAHEHPTMRAPSVTPGNGLILYFRTDKLQDIRGNAERLGYPVEEEFHVNENSAKEELSLWDLDGYYLTITAFHRYSG